MTKTKREFDLAAFYSALESTMKARKNTWKDVASATNVGQSTLSRMRHGQRPDASSLASLSAWSGLNPADFVSGIDHGRVETLAQVSRFIHSDPRLSAESAIALDELMKSTYQRLATDVDES